MLYAILCYDSEEAVSAWTKEQDAAAMAKLAVVTENLAKAGKLGPVARLMNTTSATTVRKARESMVLDGPFAETKEQLLGFFVVDCTSLDDAVETARNLAGCYNSNGAFEIRPLRFFNPGVGLK
ncbi:MAG TPA: YciI family protein [Polyangia bacterium]|nr:YciI family protein [Polyangia bacterium]